MPCIDITKPAKYEINPTKAGETDLIDTFYNEVGTTTFMKFIGLFDRGIELYFQMGKGRSSKLSFTKAGFIIGDSSLLAHIDHEYIWKWVNKVFPITPGKLLSAQKERNQLFFIGQVMRWRVSLRKEKYWFTNKKASGMYDPLTGDEIYIAQYWYVHTTQTLAPRPKSKLHKMTSKAMDKAYSDYEDNNPMFAAMAKAMKKKKWDRLET